MQKFDAIIIGTGQAGPSLARRLVAAGRKVAIIERGHFGGTCVNNGCTPTKALIASAYAAHVARRHANYGVAIGGPVTVDMKAVKARKDAIVAPSRNGVERSLRALEGCTVFQGHGRFVSPTGVKVGETVLEAPQIFINVGGRATVPAMPGLDEAAYFTSETMMDVDFLPRHLIVIGGSYIGLEFAQMYRRFGSQVTVIEMAPRLIAREDVDVSMGVADVLEAEGIELRLNATCRAARKHPDGVAVHVECTEGAPDVPDRTCCSRSGGGRMPMISASTVPVLRWTRAGSSR
jgi:pyruvate/2-oxoglutarate dehydrogenase complex dihydrolipoamide dehydrogenase (E3) component